MVEENKTNVEKEMKEEVKTEAVEKAPKGVPSAQMASDKSDKVGKVETKKPAKKVEAKIHDKAIANGFGLKISPKQCKYTCRVIRGKSPSAAVERLQAVIEEKRPVPMAALEIGHRKGKGLAGGRFPKNACKGIMEIVKQAGANAVVLGIENPVIAIARSDQAAAPFRKAGRRAKRTHMYIEIRDKVKMMEEKGRKVEDRKLKLEKRKEAMK